MGIIGVVYPLIINWVPHPEGACHIRDNALITTGPCDPQLHYKIDIQERLSEIKKLVDDGKYFTINRARQYRKTTTLKALEDYLHVDHPVVSMDFQKLSHEDEKVVRWA